MLIDTLSGFISHISPGTRILGLDVGEKTIGLALSDSNHTIATPLLTLKRRKFSLDVVALMDIVHTHEVGGLVIGLPLNTDGSEGRKCQSVRQFARNILKEYTIPILLWDERFSTFSAEQALDESGLARRKQKQVIDKVAAGIILQHALDSKNT